MTLMDLVRRLRDSQLPVKFQMSVEGHRILRLVASAGGPEMKRSIGWSFEGPEGMSDTELDWIVAQMANDAVTCALAAGVTNSE